MLFYLLLFGAINDEYRSPLVCWTALTFPRRTTTRK